MKEKEVCSGKGLKRLEGLETRTGGFEHCHLMLALIHKFSIGM